MKTLVEGGVDLLAIETIPAQNEAEALTSLLAEYPTTTAWLTYTCKVLNFPPHVILCNTF